MLLNYFSGRTLRGRSRELESKIEQIRGDIGKEETDLRQVISAALSQEAGELAALS